MLNRLVTSGLALAGIVLAAAPVSAQDARFGKSDGSFRYFAGIGMANIKAGEYVYSGNRKISQLDWESKGVKTGTIGGEVDIGYAWRLKGRLDVGLGGDGYMEDWDWLSTSYSGWTHQSLHPDTELDRYINVLLEAERALVDTGATRLGVGGGVGYTNVKWTARGGSYIYSDVTLHDTVGDFADGEKGISYEQRIPTLFLSANAEQRIGALTLSGVVRGGAALGYKGVDDHWMRDLRFTDTMDLAPMMGATVTADYRILPSAAIYVGGDFQQIFKTRGDARVRNTVTGASGSFDDGAATDYQSIMMTAGVKGSF
ncbi:omptin family outer membrane protease [Rhizobium rhizophilum]|uniref:Omptin family outer membrane protease n=1 Tax=Rhizobium rhizophilum TaxID=1850373 RepID=A0ABY2QUA7_9HYPH|nr:omptin family outer membrane protease [Rhizobium rhizophilum]THV14032.1 omptin family outer membrane protease [Rhizobium rhizophilum]